MKFKLFISVDQKSGPEVSQDDVLDALCYALWSDGGLEVRVNDADEGEPSIFHVTGADDRE